MHLNIRDYFQFFWWEPRRFLRWCCDINTAGKLLENCLQNEVHTIYMYIDVHSQIVSVGRGKSLMVNPIIILDLFCFYTSFPRDS